MTTKSEAALDGYVELFRVRLDGSEELPDPGAYLASCGLAESGMTIEIRSVRFASRESMAKAESVRAVGKRKCRLVCKSSDPYDCFWVCLTA